jgi:hypothetical protein
MPAFKFNLRHYDSVPLHTYMPRRLERAGMLSERVGGRAGFSADNSPKEDREDREDGRSTGGSGGGALGWAGRSTSAERGRGDRFSQYSRTTSVLANARSSSGAAREAVARRFASANARSQHQLQLHPHQQHQQHNPQQQGPLGDAIDHHSGALEERLRALARADASSIHLHTSTSTPSYGKPPVPPMPSAALQRTGSGGAAAAATAARAHASLAAAAGGKFADADAGSDQFGNAASYQGVPIARPVALPMVGLYQFNPVVTVESPV